MSSSLVSRSFSRQPNKVKAKAKEIHIHDGVKESRKFEMKSNKAKQSKRRRKYHSTSKNHLEDQFIRNNVIFFRFPSIFSAGKLGNLRQMRSTYTTE